MARATAAEGGRSCVREQGGRYGQRKSRATVELQQSELCSCLPLLCLSGNCVKTATRNLSEPLCFMGGLEVAHGPLSSVVSNSTDQLERISASTKEGSSRFRDKHSLISPYSRYRRCSLPLSTVLVGGEQTLKKPQENAFPLLH